MREATRWPWLYPALVVTIGSVSCFGTVCVRSDHRVETEPAFTGDPSEYGDTFDWQRKGPLEFLEHLRAVSNYSVHGIHQSWVKSEDVSDLVALLDSDEKCGAVSMTISSYHETHGSTVGQEAAFLLKGFIAGRYPPGLNSTRPTVDKNEIREWWKRYQKSRGT